MLPAVAARLARLRQPASAARLARSLWIAWAIVLWKVIFGRVLVVAGRSSMASTLLLLAGFAAISAASRPSVRRVDA